MLSRCGAVVIMINILRELINCLVGLLSQYIFLKKYSICNILTTTDNKLWIKITSNTTALDDLLPPRRIGTYAAGAMITYYLEFVLHVLNPLL